MIHHWTVLCEKSIIDSETNNISILNVIEKIEIGLKLEKDKETPTEINIPVQYELTSLWSIREKTEEKLTLKIIITNPTGKNIMEMQHTLDVPKDKQRLRTRQKVQGMKLDVSGTYKLMLLQKANDEFLPVAELPLEVDIKIQRV